MKLGKIQSDIVAFLSRCERGAFIGSTTKAKELRGYDLEQVQRSLAGLERRGIVRQEGICTILDGRYIRWAAPFAECPTCCGNPYWGKTLSSWERCICVKQRTFRG